MKLWSTHGGRQAYFVVEQVPGMSEVRTFAIIEDEPPRRRTLLLPARSRAGVRDGALARSVTDEAWKRALIAAELGEP